SEQRLRQSFDAGLAAFWWSHVPNERMDEFLTCFHRHLEAGARVVLLDNAYAAGSSTPVSRRDAAGNTYQLRTLEDGSAYEVLKNFPERERFVAQLERIGDEVDYTELEYYWYASYRLKT
ncbi:MAG: class I SAM-dependent methyltransferase, partial [Gammaproteobacteria bacterium]|nr:class I SAM-dependent methyltransferase [Gammaproteobacteria bacterium]